jgi:hypothetical protein
MLHTSSSSSIARFQGVLDTLPSRPDEGDLTGMIGEHAELAGPRGRANRVILDDTLGADESDDGALCGAHTMPRETTRHEGGHLP